jgi:hypothetical protein
MGTLSRNAIGTLLDSRIVLESGEIGLTARLASDSERGESLPKPTGLGLGLVSMKTVKSRNNDAARQDLLNAVVSRKICANTGRSTKPIASASARVIGPGNYATFRNKISAKLGMQHSNSRIVI